SQGFIHSDDHFDSVEVAYDWLRDGPTGENGYLRWKDWPSEEIGRFPLYTLSLFAVMKTYQASGTESLHVMMYGIRFIHMLFSLIPVAVAFGIVRLVSKNYKWAVLAGLLVALNFSLPFLGVRNLIEIVGGNLWAGALYYFYRYRHEDNDDKFLILAGVITGFAWMIRFQIAFAALPIPFILWYEAKAIRPAIVYSLSVGAMLFLSGLLDLIVLGSFASSTVRVLTRDSSLGALYKTVPLMYPAELLAFLVPPFSILVFYLFFRPGFMKRHLLLFISSMSFIICHMSHFNQQERFIMPIIPVMIIMAALALWEKYKADGYIVKNKTLFKWVVIPSVAINLLLLFFMTFSSGHAGQVSPLVWMEKTKEAPSYLVFQPEVKQWMPMDYAGFETPEYAQIRKWEELKAHLSPPWKEKEWSYFLFYPKQDDDLSRYLDSAQAVFGPLERVRDFEPSFYDNLLHLLNKRHNPSFKCYMYRPVQK
ncbi:MAG: hypothetical protein KAR42_17420, partial [candidate division Zixibacteria bacterium]|nr:hypothetical protein [candidate division Zixibacteria bacterium]